MKLTSTYLLIPFLLITFVKANISDDCAQNLNPCITGLKYEGHPRPEFDPANACIYQGHEMEGELCEVDPNGSVKITCRSPTKDYTMTVKYTNGIGSLTDSNTVLFNWVWTGKGTQGTTGTTKNEGLIVGCQIG